MDQSGNLRRFFASQQNVTRQREAAARQSELMESLGALASGIAHQFNNLMTVVVSTVEQASARATDDAKGSSYGVPVGAPARRVIWRPS